MTRYRWQSNVPRTLVPQELELSPAAHQPSQSPPSSHVALAQASEFSDRESGFSQLLVITLSSSFVELLAGNTVASFDEVDGEVGDAAPPSNQLKIDDLNKLEIGESINDYYLSYESDGVFMEREQGQARSVKMTRRR